MICLGIEGTAHTLGVGIVDGKKILSNAKDVYVPAKGGIHPIEAKNHHHAVKEKILEEALSKANISIDDVDLIAYSAGPGLPPCLKVVAEFASELAKNTKKPLIEVNHCISHIEIGKLMTSAVDPITIYVSGGNTQIIGYASQRYRVFGETQDISIGNAIDTFIREATGNAGSGGPVMERLAKGGKYIELPYVVKGMDLSFSGIMTAALQKHKQGAKIEDLCYSFQETCYSMLTEVTERAMAHTAKKECLLTGGVAASQRLQEMLRIMCEERNAKFFVCPREFAGDNGAMIAWNGLLAYSHRQKTCSGDFHQRWRTDEVEIEWIK
ncbi:MAG: bifunctional N(6)-L-threonylcarbamoyladenine synthase/serine/threonine protein kinase [Candidatus Aenigmatarchaeota archaeon]